MIETDYLNELNQYKYRNDELKEQLGWNKIELQNKEDEIGELEEEILGLNKRIDYLEVENQNSIKAKTIAEQSVIEIFTDLIASCRQGKLTYKKLDDHLKKLT